MNKQLNYHAIFSKPIVGGLACLVLLILSACGIFPSAPAAPVEIVFDAPRETIEAAFAWRLSKACGMATARS